MYNDRQSDRLLFYFKSFVSCNSMIPFYFCDYLKKQNIFYCVEFRNFLLLPTIANKNILKNNMDKNILIFI